MNIQQELDKLLEQVRDLIRLRHYSIRTERCYCDWITRFIRYHGSPLACPLVQSNKSVNFSFCF
jgi:hypothetical protein